MSMPHSLFLSTLSTLSLSPFPIDHRYIDDDMLPDMDAEIAQGGDRSTQDRVEALGEVERLEQALGESNDDRQVRWHT